MRISMMMLVVLGGLVCGAVRPSAHEDFRVIGTLTRHQDSRIDVRDRNGKVTEIRLDKQTEVTQDKKKVDVTALKVGLSVVVDAYGDNERDLLALEIRIVPPIASGNRKSGS